METTIQEFPASTNKGNETTDAPLDASVEAVTIYDTTTHEVPEKLYCYVPSNLDVDELIQTHPPDIPRFHRDKLVYMIGSLYVVSGSKDFCFDDYDGYIPINAEIAKSKVREYNKYLAYLTDCGVIEQNLHYIYLVGKRSKCYRFTDEYNTVPKQEIISKLTLRKSIFTKRNDAKKIYIDSTEKPLPYLKKWWNLNLEFDCEQAEDILEQLHIEDYYCGKEYVYESYISRKLTVEKFKNRDYSFHVDSTSGRLHTLLTRLKKELRPCMTYDGQKLIAVDKINSQPYLSLALLNPKSFVLNNLPNTISLYNYSFIHKSLTIMLTLLDELENKADYQQFKKLVVSGQFYENFGKMLIRNGTIRCRNEAEARNKAKEILFASIYGHNNGKLKFKHPENGKIRYVENEGMALFKKFFPSVFEVFTLIKKNFHPTLPNTLQHLEAELILHQACRLIAEEKPDLPIYTIHDSIVTTEGNEYFVESVLTQVFEEAIGAEAKFKFERW